VLRTVGMFSSIKDLKPIVSLNRLITGPGMTGWPSLEYTAVWGCGSALSGFGSRVSPSTKNTEVSELQAKRLFFFGCTQLFWEFRILCLLYSPLVKASLTYAAWPHNSNNINTAIQLTNPNSLVSLSNINTAVWLLMSHLWRLLVIPYNLCRWPAILNMMLKFIGSSYGKTN